MGIFFLASMALSYCCAWSQVKCLSCCAKLFLSVSVIKQGYLQTLTQVAIKNHPVFKMHELPAEIDCAPF